MGNEKFVPGWERGDMEVHRTNRAGDTYCGAETYSIGDEESSLDAVRNHGARLCARCDVAAAEDGHAQRTAENRSW